MILIVEFRYRFILGKEINISDMSLFSKMDKIMDKIIQQYPVLKFLALVVCGLLILTETAIIIDQSAEKRQVQDKYELE